MSTDEYEAIPEAEWKVLATTETTHLTDEEKDYLPHAWDEWIARVKRDAFEKGIATGYMRGYHDSEVGLLYSPPLPPTFPKEDPR